MSHPCEKERDLEISWWMFPKIGVPQNGWFIMENPINKWMIWGYPYFWKYPGLFLIIAKTSIRYKSPTT